MSRLVLCKIYVAFALLAFLLLPGRAFAGEFESVNPDQSIYKLWLVTWGPQSGSDAETSLDADLVWVSPAKVHISVLEPLNNGRGDVRWAYGAGPLAVGDDFVAQGHMYRVTKIDTESVKLVSPYRFVGWCMRKSCAPSVEVVKLPRTVSPSGRNAFILSKIGALPSRQSPNSGGYIGSTSDECLLNLNLDSLVKDSKGYVAHISSKLNANYYGNDTSKCHEVMGAEHVDARVGDVVDFGGFGRFKVESIWPAKPNHQAWVVLVPDNLHK